MEFLDTFSDGITAVTVLSVCAVGLYLYSIKERSGIPPGPLSWPLVGNALQMGGKYKGKRYKYFDDLHKKYGKIFRVYFGSQMYVLLNDVDFIREAFIKERDVFNLRPSDAFWNIREGNKSGIAIVWSNDQLWKLKRGFLVRALKDIGDGKSFMDARIKDEAKIVVDVLAKAEGKPIDVHNLLLHAGVNVMNCVVFGTRLDYTNPDLLHLSDIVSKVGKSEGPFSIINMFPLLRIVPPIKSKIESFSQELKKLDKFMLNHVKDHEVSYKDGVVRDLIDEYLAQKNDRDAIEERELLRILFEVYPAGSGSAGNTLEWAFIYMILNPDVQKKCQSEIGRVLGSNCQVSWSDRSKMPYVQATLAEVQRVASVTPLAVPHTPVHDIEIQGFLIPKGAIVSANIYSCHRQKKSWDDPMVFKPERFIDEVGNFDTPPAFMPFSTGPRSCPGERLIRIVLFVFFTSVLQKFNISGSGDLNTEGLYGINLYPEPFLLRAEKRI